MPSDRMMQEFSRKKAPKFEDEGPPGNEDARGTSGGMDDDSDEVPEMLEGDGPPPSMSGPEAMDPEAMAADDLADLLGVGPEDRDDFAAALGSYVSSCIEKAMMEQMAPEGEEMPEAMDGAQGVQGMPNPPASGV